MRKLKLFLSLLMAVLSIGQMWAADETIATGTFNGKNANYTTGWSTTGTGKSRTDCIVVGKNENVTSPFIDLSDYKSISITFTGRRYGSLTGSKATVAVAFAGSNIGSIDFTNGSVGAVSGSVDWTVQGTATGTFVFTCTNATSAGSTHGAGIGSITITGVKKGSAELVSITVTGDLTTKAYEEGDLIDFAGLTATGNYDDSSSEDITSEVEWSFTPALTVGTTSVTVTATKGEISGDKVISGITVAEHSVTPGTYDITTDNNLWGTSFSGSAGNITSLSGSKYDVSITINKNSGSGMYVTDSQTRIYNGYTMIISVPNGFSITALKFTADGSNWAGEHTANVGTMTDNKNWSGDANSVTITVAGTCRMKAVKVTYVASKLEAGLAYAAADAQKIAKVGGSLEAPTLTNPNSLAVSYASSDENVVKVNASNGAITEIVAAGIAVITASSEEDATHKAGSASYTIFVAEQAGTEADALTEASAKALIDLGCAMNVHVKGTVKEQHQTYYTVTLTEDFKFWSLKDLGNVDFTTAYLKAGDQVTAYGQLTKVGQNYELAEGCYLTAYEEYTAPKQSIANDKEHPYTIAQALEFGADPVTYETSEAIYVKGVVYDFGYYGSTSNIYIRDIDKTVADGKLELFKCAGLKEGDADPVAFANDAVVQLDTIIGYGVLKYFSGNAIWEFDGGENDCYVVEHIAYVEPTYTISFDANTNAAYTGNLPADATVTKDDVYQIPAACLTRTDNYFQAGWNTDQNATDKMTATELSNVQEDVVLYAIWKEITDCQITFYNIDTENAYDTKVKTQGVEYTFDDIVAPTAPSGYTFAGWSTSLIPTEAENITPLTAVTPNAAAMTLYAVYSRTEGTAYTKYEKVTSAPADWAGNYLIVYEGDATHAAVAFNGALETLDAAENGIAVTINEGVIAGPTELDAAIFTIAAMEENYSIQSAHGEYIGRTTNSNGMNVGSSAYAQTIAISNDEAVITSSAGPTLRYNYGANDLRFRYYKSGQKPIQLYAQVHVLPTVYCTTNPTPRYTVTFSLAEDENGDFEPISVAQGEDATLPTEVPTKLHKVFNKWVDGNANEYAAGATIENVIANIVLSATWNDASHAAVTFVLNGPEGEIAPMDVYEGEEYNLPEAPAYDNDHVFVGWKHGDDVFNANALCTMAVPAEAIEYVAQWADKVVDNVIILAQYDDRWFALKNTVTTNKVVDAMEVAYYEGQVLNLSAEEQAAITWERTIVGDKVTFKNGEKYVQGTTGTELYLSENAFEWTLIEDDYLCKAGDQEYKRTFIYKHGTGFKNYDKGNAGDEGYSEMPVVVAAAFGEGVAYTVVRENLEIDRYYTICLEKEITDVKGATFWNMQYRNDAGSLAYLEEVTLPLDAGKPYIFQATADKLEVIYNHDSKVELPENNGALRGTFAEMSQNAFDAVSAANDNSLVYMLVNNTLRQVAGMSNNHLAAHRAYVLYSAFEIDTPQAAPGRRVRAIPMQENTATDLEGLEATDAPVKVLIDGQIYILRGEKMFDTTGRMVK